MGEWFFCPKTAPRASGAIAVAGRRSAAYVRGRCRGNRKKCRESRRYKEEETGRAISATSNVS
jgi:hypothetical protein